MALFGSAALLMLLAAKVPELALASRPLILGRRFAVLTALISAPLWMVLAGTGPAAILSQPLFLARMALLLGLVLAVWRNHVKASFWIAGACLGLIAAAGHAAAASPGGFAAIGAA